MFYFVCCLFFSPLTCYARYYMSYIVTLTALTQEIQQLILLGIMIP